MKPRVLLRVILCFGIASGCKSAETTDYGEKAIVYLNGRADHACCSSADGLTGQRCIDEAETKCAYVKAGAKFEVTKIAPTTKPGRDVTVEVKGRNGKGRCVVFVAEITPGENLKPV